MDAIRLARWKYPVTTLGPGNRAVLWVQGCPFKCPDCIVPEWLPARGGETVTITSLGEAITALPELTGITISGGEPMLQAAALAQLIKAIRKRRAVDLICFTGYTFEWLEQFGNAGQREFLQQVDLLIDGLYQRELHADLLWRGSSNQRLIAMTDKYRQLVEGLTEESDRSAGLEFHIDTDGALSFAGVPSRRGFRKELEMQLEKQGIRLLG